MESPPSTRPHSNVAPGSEENDHSTTRWFPTGAGAESIRTRALARSSCQVTVRGRPVFPAASVSLTWKVKMPSA
jgi:hypothetical protein